MRGKPRIYGARPPPLRRCRACPARSRRNRNMAGAILRAFVGCRCADMASYQTINPFDGRALRTVELLSAAAVEQRLAVAEAAFPRWAGMTLEQRGTLLRKAAAGLRARRDD